MDLKALQLDIKPCELHKSDDIRTNIVCHKTLKESKNNLIDNNQIQKNESIITNGGNRVVNEESCLEERLRLLEKRVDEMERKTNSVFQVKYIIKNSLF